VLFKLLTLNDPVIPLKSMLSEVRVIEVGGKVVNRGLKAVKSLLRAEENHVGG